MAELATNANTSFHISSQFDSYSPSPSHSRVLCACATSSSSVFSVFLCQLYSATHRPGGYTTAFLPFCVDAHAFMKHISHVAENVFGRNKER